MPAVCVVAVESAVMGTGWIIVVSNVIPRCTFFHELLQSYSSITPTTLLILHSFLGHRLLLSKITRSNNQQAIHYMLIFDDNEEDRLVGKVYFHIPLQEVIPLSR